MRVLVLSGGAAKGRWQAGVIYELWKRGYTWDAVIGVSVGALNGALVAMGEYELMKEIWANIRNKDVYTGKLNAWHLLKAVVLGKKGVLGNKPLRNLLEKHLDTSKITIPYCCLSVGLDNGETHVMQTPPRLEDTSKEELIFGIVASATMPVIWEPVYMLKPYTDTLVDGGLRDNSPLGQAIEIWNPKHITIINTGGVALQEKKPRNLLEIAARSLEIVLHETLENDMHQFIRINKLVLQAQKEGFPLRKGNGTVYKYFNHEIYQPTEPLGELLDFTQYQRFDEGRAAV